MFAQTCKERMAIGDPIDPASKSANTYTSGSIDMSKFRRAIFILSVGSMAASSTVDATLHESADDSTFGAMSGGSGNSITQLTQAGSDSNKIVTIEVRSDQLSSGKRYVRLSVVVAVDAVLLCVIPIGMDPIYSPANSLNNAAVDEQVVKASA